jgi:hypothetical protein
MWTLILLIEPSHADHVRNDFNLLLVIAHPNRALGHSIHTAYDNCASHPTSFMSLVSCFFKLS